MAIPSSILAWKNPCTEELGELLSMGSQGVGHNLVAKHTHTHSHYIKPYECFLKKLKIEYPHDPAILLPGMFPEKMKRYIHLNIHSSTIYNS